MFANCPSVSTDGFGWIWGRSTNPGLTLFSVLAPNQLLTLGRE